MPLQTPDPLSPMNGFVELFWFVIAVAGGIARFLDTYLRTGVFPAVGRMAAHALVSGFSGYMVAQVVMKISPEWTLVAAGVGGYLGTQGIDWISNALHARIEAAIPSIPHSPVEPPPPSTPAVFKPEGPTT